MLHLFLSCSPKTHRLGNDTTGINFEIHIFGSNGLYNPVNTSCHRIVSFTPDSFGRIKAEIVPNIDSILFLCHRVNSNASTSLHHYCSVRRTPRLGTADNLSPHLLQEGPRACLLVHQMSSMTLCLWHS